MRIGELHGDKNLPPSRICPPSPTVTVVPVVSSLPFSQNSEKKVTRFGTNSDELFHARTAVKARSRGVWQNNAASIRGIFVALTTGYLRRGGGGGAGGGLGGGLGVV